jgi:hypothetical protein
MPTRAVTASSSFSTSTSSRFLFCCEACFLTLVGRVRPVIPGATISAHYRVFGMESNFCRIAEKFRWICWPVRFRRGGLSSPTRSVASAHSPNAPRHNLCCRLHLYSTAGACYLRTKLIHEFATSVTSIIHSSSLLPPLNLKMADIEAELAAAGKELDKVGRLHKPIRAPR